MPWNAACAPCTTCEPWPLALASCRHFGQGFVFFCIASTSHSPRTGPHRAALSRSRSAFHSTIGRLRWGTRCRILERGIPALVLRHVLAHPIREVVAHLLRDDMGGRISEHTRS